MELRPFGTTGFSIAPLVLGGNVFGWTADEATSHALLDAFVDDERVDIARRLVDERAWPRDPVALQVVPGALYAEAHYLAARVAVAVDPT